MKGKAQTEKNFNRFLLQLKTLNADLDESAKRVVNQMADVGMAKTVGETPHKTGYLKKMWFRQQTKKNSGKWKVGYQNNVYYAIYVNNGHRRVNTQGETTGWTSGKHMLEKGMNEARRQSETLFRMEVSRVKKESGF